MKPLICEGMCEFFGGCHGPVRAVVVSRIGECNLCTTGIEAFRASGAAVSEIYHRVSDDNNRPEVDSDILRQLGHYLLPAWKEVS
jgi:hypothetical protein